MVDFHGWEMPIRYGSIPAEHTRVRESAGLFDLCHMGRLEFRGSGSEVWLQRVLTCDVSTMAPGRARYGLICNDHGRPIDDAIVYRLREEARLPGEWLLVVNASNRLPVIDWLAEHKPAGADASLVDRTEDWAMIAVQGPESAKIVAALVERPAESWEKLRYYQITSGEFSPGKGAPERVRVARTGYTGEDGFEVYVDRELATAFWSRALEIGGERIGPTGLGARDTLRLEAGMPLYGNEIDASIHPFEAGLGFAVALDKGEFVGREALRALKDEGNKRNLRGFRVESRRIARQGMKIFRGENEVGFVTSGAPSPTLGCPIALGYLQGAVEEAPAEESVARGALTVDLRGRRESLTLVELPFFSRTRKKTSTQT